MWERHEQPGHTSAGPCPPPRIQDTPGTLHTHEAPAIPEVLLGQQVGLIVLLRLFPNCQVELKVFDFPAQLAKFLLLKLNNVRKKNLFYNYNLKEGIRGL